MMKLAFISKSLFSNKKLLFLEFLLHYFANTKIVNIIGLDNIIRAFIIYIFLYFISKLGRKHFILQIVLFVVYVDITALI